MKGVQSIMVNENQTDSIFNSNCEAIVNPVNCSGKMGAGLAALFKAKFPDYCDDYIDKCRSRQIRVGGVDIYETDLLQPKYIISFPTKDHWSDKSQIPWIEDGLIDLKDVLKEYEIKSIAIPNLGCGLGGLKVNDVKRLVHEFLDDMNECKVDLHLFGN